MLQPGQNICVLEANISGIFAEVYKQHGDGEVPSVLQACESLDPGEKIVADRDGTLVFAGTVRARPNRFLAPLVRITRIKGSTDENAEVELPLHYFYFSEDGYGHRIIGGGMERQWVTLANLVLRPGCVDDSEIRRTTLSVGLEQIMERQAAFSDRTVRKVMQELAEMPDDTHFAIGGIGTRQARRSPFLDALQVKLANY